MIQGPRRWWGCGAAPIYICLCLPFIFTSYENAFLTYFCTNSMSSWTFSWFWFNSSLKLVTTFFSYFLKISNLIEDKTGEFVSHSIFPQVSLPCNGQGSIYGGIPPNEVTCVPCCRLQNELDVAKKDFESRQKVLQRAYTELEKRMHEHDNAVSSGFERTDVTLSVSASVH